MSDTVDSSFGELSKVARELDENIEALRLKVATLESTIGKVDLADPKSEVTVDMEGSMELVGGTFAVGRELHGSLQRELLNWFDEDEGDVRGAGNLEVLTLGKVGSSAEVLDKGMADIKKVVSDKINDIVSLKKVMQNELNHILKASDKDNSKLQMVIGVFKHLNDEFDAQVNALQRVIDHKVQPVASDLADLLKNNKSFKTLASKLGDEYNTSDASDRLALAYTQMSKLKSTSAKVSEALGSLKMTLNDYKQLKSVTELEKALTSVLAQSNNKSALMKSIKLLKSSFPNHKEIIADLEKGGGAYSSQSVGRVSKGKTKTLNTRVKTYEDTIKEIFAMFISQVGSNFVAIKNIFENLGDSDIKYDSKLKTFISIFENFNSDLQNGKVFYALIGLDQSVTGRELKNRFTSNLEESIEALSPLSSEKLLRDVQNQLSSVRDTINSYNDILNDAKREESRLKEGGDFFEPNQTGIINVSKTIKEAITKLKFYANLSTFKENLSRVSKEYPDMQSGYDQLLGKSIGAKLTELQKEYTENMGRLSDTDRGRGWVLKNYNEKNPSEKIPKGLVENIYKLQYEAKVGLYKTLEAVDLYLMHFTEKVSGDVTALKELNELLSQTELVSAWADETSVDRLQNLSSMIKSSEFMTTAAALSTGSMVSKTVTAFTDGTSIRKVLDACKQSVESIAVLRNLIAMFMKIGDKFSSGSLSQDNYMSSGTMYNNLVRYVWVSAFTMGHGTAGGNPSKLIESDKKDKGDYEIEAGDKESFFDLKMTSVTTPLDLLRTHENKMRGVLEKKLKDLEGTEYEDVTSDVSLLAAASTAEKPKDIVEQMVISNPKQTKTSVKNLLDSLNGKDIFQTEDKYFVLIMKSLAAKILTVVGVSNLLNRPSKITTMVANPVRSILGAADTMVNPEAVELYIRLPLVVEFYKNVFGDGNEKYKKNSYSDDNSETIAFIPEMGSKWSGLIQCIFDESRQIKSGIYSIENMRRIISEINSIKAHYPESSARDVVLDLVNEINRRYGIMKRSDINDFYQSKKKYSMSGEVSYKNDFDILDPDSGDLDSLGPSSGFVQESFQLESSLKNKSSQDDISIVKEFRDLIRSELYSKDLNSLADKSFDERVKSFKQQVLSARSENEKVEIVMKAIDDSGDVSNFNVDMLAAYHELVRFPLSVLYKNFNQHLHSIAGIVVVNMINNATLSPKEKALIMLARSLTAATDSEINEVKNLFASADMLKILNKLSSDFDEDLSKRTVISAFLNKGELYYSKDNSRLPKLIELVEKATSEFDRLGLGYPFTVNYIKESDTPEALAAYKLYDAIFTNKPNDGDLVVGLDFLNYLDIVFLKGELAKNLLDPTYGYLLNIIRVYSPKSIDEVDTDGFEEVINTLKRNAEITTEKVKAGFNFIKERALAISDKLSAEANRLLRRAESNADISLTDLEEIVKEIVKKNRVNANVRKFITNIRKSVKKSEASHELTDAEVELLSSRVGAIDFSKDNVKFSLIKEILGVLKKDDLNEFLENLSKSGKYEIDVFLGAFKSAYIHNKPSIVTYLVQNFKNSSVDIKYMSNGKVVLDYSKLQKEVESSLQLVKYVSGKYRHLVPAKVALSVDEQISFIEHSYLFKMIYSQDNGSDVLLSQFNFEKCNSSLNSALTTFNELERKMDYVYLSGNLSTIYKRVCDLFPEGLSVNEFFNKPLMHSTLKETFKTYDESKKQWVSLNGASVDGTKLGELKIMKSIYEPDNSLSEKSLLLKFNNIVVRYIETFFESSTKKFYSPLLTDICKSQSTCIYTGIGLKDINKVRSRISIGDMVFSENDSVLAESVGHMINILTTRDIVKQLDKKMFALTNIKDVSVNMVDRFYTYLPVFIAMFSKIIESCMVYKNMIELMAPEVLNLAVDVGQELISEDVKLLGNSSDDTYLLSGKLVKGSSSAYSHISNTLNNLIEASRSMIESAKNVLMEIDYNPKHLEIKANFSKNFQENFKVQPTTPVSAILAEVNMLPSNYTPAGDYKMTRGLVYSLGDGNDFPWMRQLLADIKSSTTGDNSVDADRAMEGLLDVVKLAKGIVDYRFFNMFGLLNLSTKNENYTHGPEVSTFYDSRAVNDYVSLTENNSTDNSKKLLANKVTAVSRDVLDRPSARLLNLIDMNINPINTHSLMREIPLVNVYNYAFTFDDIVSKDFGINDIYSDFMKDRKMALGSILIDPYFNLEQISSSSKEVGKNSDIIPEAIGIYTYESKLRQSLTGRVDVNENIKLGIGKYVKEIGQEMGSTQFNTKFVRNLVFMTNIQRYLLAKIKSEVHRVNGRKVKSGDILSDRIVSYGSDKEKLMNSEFDLLEL